MIMTFFLSSWCLLSQDQVFHGPKTANGEFDDTACSGRFLRVSGTCY